MEPNVAILLVEHYWMKSVWMALVRAIQAGCMAAFLLLAQMGEVTVPMVYNGNVK